MTATLDRISRLDSLIRLFEEEKPQSKPLIAFR
jgi:hypothetical protein